MYHITRGSSQKFGKIFRDYQIFEKLSEDYGFTFL